MPKKIVLFADGTGNAFSAQESNIWRLFCALDTTQSDQIALYVEGVGTSAFRPWAIFDATTGWNAPANILKLYTFLCWNWEQGDEVYMFGFSRGAFEIRALIELINTEGLVPRGSSGGNIPHSQFEMNALAAWRSYRDGIVPRYNLGWKCWRHVILPLFSLVGPRSNSNSFSSPRQLPGKIKFVGLFDTVEAFGVPLEALRLAINRFLLPISFPIEEMSGHVCYVRHALSLDDERTSFHPIRVRLREKCNVEKGDVHPLREVWFAGAHSDVGGGYPDDQLARIALTWMIDEIRKVEKKFAEDSGTDSDKERLGLRFRVGVEDEFQRVSSAYGTLHDSRKGKSALYRYSPRRFSQNHIPNPPLVHHSVIKRVLGCANNYAPVNLPHNAHILRADGAVVSLQEYLERRQVRTTSNWFDIHIETQGELTANILLRQAIYFAMIFGIICLSASPIWIPIWEQNISFDDTLEDFFDMITDPAVSTMHAILPSYFKPYLDAIRARPIPIIIVTMFVICFYKMGNARQDRIRDLACVMWRPGSRTAPLNAASVRAKIFSKIRKCSRFSRYDFIHLLSNAAAYLGVALVLIILCLVFVRFCFAVVHGAGGVCSPTKETQLIWLQDYDAVSASDAPKTSTELRSVSRSFRTNSPCWASGVALEKGIAYRLRLDLEEPWFDHMMMTDVGGYENNGFIPKVFKAPLLRWPSAGWFQPIARIGPRGNAEWPLVDNSGSGPIPSGQKGRDCKLIPSIYRQSSQLGIAEQIQDKDLEGAEKAWRNVVGKWKNGQSPCFSAYPRRALVVDFVAEKTGELFLFVNDIIPLLPIDDHGPWRISRFIGRYFGRYILLLNDYISPLPTTAHYANNRGSAEITLSRVPPAGMPP